MVVSLDSADFWERAVGWETGLCALGWMFNTTGDRAEATYPTSYQLERDLATLPSTCCTVDS